MQILAFVSQRREPENTPNASCGPGSPSPPAAHARAPKSLHLHLAALLSLAFSLAFANDGFLKEYLVSELSSSYQVSPSQHTTLNS